MIEIPLWFLGILLVCGWVILGLVMVTFVDWLHERHERKIQEAKELKNLKLDVRDLHDHVSELDGDFEAMMRGLSRKAKK